MYMLFNYVFNNICLVKPKLSVAKLVVGAHVETSLREGKKGRSKRVGQFLCKFMHEILHDNCF